MTVRYSVRDCRFGVINIKDFGVISSTDCESISYSIFSVNISPTVADVSPKLF